VAKPIAPSRRVNDLSSNRSAHQGLKDTVRWQIDLVDHERKNITLLARLDLENRSFLDFYVLPNVNRPKRFQICQTDNWLRRGVRIDNRVGLLTGVQIVLHSMR
jgi:hypothetical protein